MSSSHKITTKHKTSNTQTSLYNTILSRLVVRTAIKAQRPIVRQETSVSAIANRNFLWLKSRHYEEPLKQAMPIRTTKRSEEKDPSHKALDKEDAMETTMLYKET